MKKHLQSFVQNPHLGWFIRLGYIIRGILYGLVGVGVLQFVVGLHNAVIDTSGEIKLIQRSPAGNYLLIVVIVGLAGYSLWGFIRAFLDVIEHKNELTLVQRLGYIFSAISYGLLIIPTIYLLLNIKSESSEERLSRNISQLISLPMGNVIVAIVGICVMAGGAFQLRRAIVADKPIDFTSTENRKIYSVPFMIFAKTGVGVRAATFILSGYYIMMAGLSYNPHVAQSLHQILIKISHTAFGLVVLPGVGIGLVFFGIYSILLSLWVDLP